MLKPLPPAIYYRRFVWHARTGEDWVLQVGYIFSGRLTTASMAQMVDELSLHGLENTAGMCSFGL